MWIAEACASDISLKMAAKGNAFRSPHALKKKAPSSNSLLQLASTATDESLKHIGVGGGDKLDARKRSLSLESSGKGESTMNMLPVEQEVSALCEEFVGPAAKNCYQICLFLLTFSGLLAYAQVFIAAFTKLAVDSIVMPPFIPTIVFSLVVIPLSLSDLTEQVFIQSLMSLLRFVSLGILIFGTLIATRVAPLASGDGSNNDVGNHPFGGFGLMFSTAVFSQLFQHSVPGLIRPLAQDQKVFVPKIFFYAILTTCLIYISIGVSCALYFEGTLKESVNLNFIGFYWGLEDTNTPGGYVLFACSLIVVLFPALDTLSVFPLIANTLGGSLNASFGKSMAKYLTSTLDVDRRTARKYVAMLWKLVAAVPPILFATLSTDGLSFYLQLAGLAGVFISFIFPTIIGWCARNDISALPLALQVSPYSTASFKSNFYVGLILSLAIVGLAVSSFQLMHFF